MEDSVKDSIIPDVRIKQEDDEVIIVPNPRMSVKKEHDHDGDVAIIGQSNIAARELEELKHQHQKQQEALEKQLKDLQQQLCQQKQQSQQHQEQLKQQQKEAAKQQPQKLQVLLAYNNIKAQVAYSESVYRCLFQGFPTMEAFHLHLNILSAPQLSNLYTIVFDIHKALYQPSFYLNVSQQHWKIWLKPHPGPRLAHLQGFLAAVSKPILD